MDGGKDNNMTQAQRVYCTTVRNTRMAEDTIRTKSGQNRSFTREKGLQTPPGPSGDCEDEYELDELARIWPDTVRLCRKLGATCAAFGYDELGAYADPNNGCSAVCMIDPDNGDVYSIIWDNVK